MPSSGGGVGVEEREGADILRMFAAQVTQEGSRASPSRRFARSEQGDAPTRRYSASADGEDGHGGEAELTYGQSARAGPRGNAAAPFSNDEEMQEPTATKTRRNRVPLRQKGSVSESSTSSGGSDASSGARESSRPSSSGDAGAAQRGEHAGSGDHDSAVSGGSSNDGGSSSRDAGERPSLSQSITTGSRTHVSGSTRTTSSGGTMSSDAARSATGKRSRSSGSAAASNNGTFPAMSTLTDVSVGAPASMRVSKRPRRAASTTGASVDEDGMEAVSPPPSTTGDGASADGVSGRRAVRRRELNRMNARKSRMRKKAHMESMMSRVNSAETQLRALRTYLIEQAHVDPDTIARAPAHVYDDMMEGDDSDLSEDERGGANTHASSAASVTAPSIAAGSAVSILARSNVTPVAQVAAAPPTVLTSDVTTTVGAPHVEPSGPDMTLVRTLSAAHLAFILTDPNAVDNPIVYASRGFCELTGYTPEEVIGRNCRFLQGPRTDKRSPFWNFLTIAPLKSSTGHVERYIGIQSCVNAPPMGAPMTTAVGLTPHTRMASAAGQFTQVPQAGAPPHAAAYMQAWMTAHPYAPVTAAIPTRVQPAFAAPPYGWAPTITSSLPVLEHAQLAAIPHHTAAMPMGMLPAPLSARAYPHAPSGGAAEVDASMSRTLAMGVVPQPVHVALQSARSAP